MALDYSTYGSRGGYTPAYGGNGFNPMQPMAPLGGYPPPTNNSNNLPGSNLPQYNNVENSAGTASQLPTNVIDVQGPLRSALANYTGYANQFANTPVNFNPVNLNSNFLGSDAYQSQLHNGIDYFGDLGISSGIQNLNLQRDTANNQLASNLMRQPGNEGILSVLQNQNLFKSQLAIPQLISQAQKDTAQRISDQINLENSKINSTNQTNLQAAGFNQQGQMAALQARLGLLQPQQNLLDLLSNLQGQARGVTAQQTQTGSKNFT